MKGKREKITISKAALRLALIRADTGAYSGLGVASIEEAEKAVDEDTDKLWKKLVEVQDAKY